MQPGTAEEIRERKAIEAWGLMGGKIDMTQIDVIEEYLGVDDVHRLMTHLRTIDAWRRDMMKASQDE